MSEKELRRVGVWERVAAGEGKLVQAAELGEISGRQGQRIGRRYRKEGAAGRVHRRAGRPSNRGYRKRWRRRGLRWVRDPAKRDGGVGERCGPTLAPSGSGRKTAWRGTPRRCGAGCWRRGCGAARGSGPRIGSGERDASMWGEWVQRDGSFEAWREERGPPGCGLHLVDDATRTTLCRRGEQETIGAAAGVLRRWIEQYGVAAGAVHGWEERLCARADGLGVGDRRSAADAVWAQVRAVGDNGSSRPVRRRPQGGWSAVTGRIRTG